MEWLQHQTWGNRLLRVASQGSNSTKNLVFCISVAFLHPRFKFYQISCMDFVYFPSSARATTRSSSSPFQLPPFTLSTTHRLRYNTTAVGRSQNFKKNWLPWTCSGAWIRKELKLFIFYKMTMVATQEGSDWEAQCLLPASHPWPDSPSLDSSGHMWLVSNRSGWLGLVSYWVNWSDAQIQTASNDRFHDFSRDSLPDSPLSSFAVLRLPLDQTPYMARWKDILETVVKLFVPDLLLFPLHPSTNLPWSLLFPLLRLFLTLSEINHRDAKITTLQIIRQQRCVFYKSSFYLHLIHLIAFTEGEWKCDFRRSKCF